MREWLSGGAPPCQGGGRGFDPRLALAKQRTSDEDVLFVLRARDGGMVPAGTRIKKLKIEISAHAPTRGDDARRLRAGHIK